MNIVVNRVKVWHKEGKPTVGFANVNSDGIDMSVRIVKSTSKPGELFIGLPSTPYQRDGKTLYRQTINLSKEMYAEVTKQVLSAYAAAVATEAKINPDLPGTKTPAISRDEINKISPAVIEGLFGTNMVIMAQPVQTYTGGLRAVQIMHYKFIVQNPNTTSEWAKLAREGHKVAQISVGGALKGVIVDSELTLY